MSGENNYAVIELQHYEAMLNELFTLRQVNACLNKENADLLEENRKRENALINLDGEVRGLTAQVADLQARIESGAPGWGGEADSAEEGPEYVG